MNWKDISSTVGKIAPTLGGLLGGPVGASIGSIISTTLGVDNTPTAVEQALKLNPEIAVKLAEIESTHKVELEKLKIEEVKAILIADSQAISDVNKSIQTEAVAEHWPTYSWRPFIGFSFGIYVNSLWLLPLFHVTPIVLTSDMTLVIGGILGIASYFRGKAQADPNIRTDNRG